MIKEFLGEYLSEIFNPKVSRSNTVVSSRMLTEKDLENCRKDVAAKRRKRIKKRGQTKL